MGADVSAAEQRRGGLWRDRDFMKFWSAETFSLLGSQVSLVAIPLLAVASLTASPFEMGVLNAAQFAPFLLLTLLAGVWVDKHRRLPMLIGTNFGRAVLFALIPLAVALKLLNIGLLSTLVFLAGMLTVVFELAYGLRLSVSNTYLRALGTEAAVYNLFNQMLWAVLILHLARGMHFHPTVIGLVLAMEGVGALLGSLVAARLGRRWGLGPTLIGSIVVANAAPLLIPAAPSGWVLAAPLIGVALMINGTGLVVYSIQAISLEQAAVTADILGRTNASYRFTVTGAAAIGALTGGALGGLIGLRATMIVGALGTSSLCASLSDRRFPSCSISLNSSPTAPLRRRGQPVAPPDDIALTPISPGPIKPNHLYAKET